MSMRSLFVEEFGAETADLLESIALRHRPSFTAFPEKAYGSDRFRWSILVTIAFECITKYAEEHEIKRATEIDEWFKKPMCKEWFNVHDGDFDLLAAMAGTYDPYVK